MKHSILILFLFLCTVQNIIAQGVGSYYNPKDDQYRLLGLKRAKELYESSKADYERQMELFGKKIISQRELDKAKMAYADAEVNYQQSLLALLFEQQYVSVIEAVKYRDSQGKKHVRLTLANVSGGGAEFKKLINIDDELFRSLMPEIVNDVYVSLLNNDNAIISQPYEAKIEEIRYGRPVTIDFEILQDLDAVTVNLVYGSGTQRAPKIFLQKDESADRVLFQSEQFSQEVNLGNSTVFNMSLELFSGTTNTYKLEVVNLPEQINSYFIDPSSSARLSQFKFTETAQTRNAGLQVFMPDRPTNEVVMDKSIPFFVIAVPYDRLNEFGNSDKNWTKKAIEEMGFGYLELELIPRGVGELLVKAPQLYFSVMPGEEIRVPFTMVNEGSRRLDNIEFQVDLPLNWTRQINPEVIESLGIREEKIVEFTFLPPDEIVAGKYEIRVRSTSLSDNRLVKAEDKTITIEIEQQANLFGTLIIVLLILGLVGGIIVFGVRLSRK